MRFVTTLLTALLSSAVMIKAIPITTPATAIKLGDPGVRIYYQDSATSLITEISIDLPTSHASETKSFTDCKGRAQTPVGAVTWGSGADTNIRFYFVNANNLLVEKGYYNGAWQAANVIGFPVSAGSTMYAIRDPSGELVVGYNGASGQLFEAYYVNGAWQNYQP